MEEEIVTVDARRPETIKAVSSPMIRVKGYFSLTPEKQREVEEIIAIRMSHFATGTTRVIYSREQ